MAAETEGMSLAELVFALKARGARIPFEIGAFVALEACEQVMARPGLVKPHLVHVAADGGVHVSALPVADESTAAKAMVDLLAHVLVAAGAGVPPTLVAFIEGATPDAARSLTRVRAELRAALMPLNRQASRRVLSRLIRESRRLGVGTLTPAPVALATPAPADAEMAAELDELVGDVTPPRRVQGVFGSAAGRAATVSPSSAGMVRAEAFSTASGTTAAGITAAGTTAPGNVPAASAAPVPAGSSTVSVQGAASASQPMTPPFGAVVDQAAGSATRADVRPDAQRSYRPPPPSRFDQVLEDTLSDHEPHASGEASSVKRSAAETATTPTGLGARAQSAAGTLGGVGEMASADEALDGPKHRPSLSGGLHVRPYADEGALSAAHGRASHGGGGTLPQQPPSGSVHDVAAPSLGAAGRDAGLRRAFAMGRAPLPRSRRLAVAVTAGIVGTLVAGLVVGPGWLMDVLGRVSASQTASEISAAEVAPQDAAPSRGQGELTIDVQVPDAQVLRYVGRGPVTIADLPTGVAHEFVAFHPGHRATRALVPADAEWEPVGQLPQAQPLRSELALQLAPTEDTGMRVGASLMPERVGEASGQHGALRIVSNPRGAKIYQLIGFAPRVRVRGIRTDAAHELLIVRDGYSPEKVVIGPSDWVTGERGPTAQIDVRLEPK